MKSYSCLNYFTLFFIVIIATLFQSCQKDDGIIEEPKQQAQRILATHLVSKEEILSNVKITTKLNTIVDSKSEYSQKNSVHDTINNLIINTNEAIYIEVSDNHSYTFFVEDIEDPSVLKNLVHSI